jgi:hypothetical protein
MTNGKVVSRAEFLAEWSTPLQNIAGDVWDTLHKLNRTGEPNAHLFLQNHLAKIGARSLEIEIPGPNGSSLQWYSMRNHIVIFQVFDEEDRWEIYTSLSAGNKVLLADACSALTSLASASS